MKKINKGNFAQILLVLVVVMFIIYINLDAPSKNDITEDNVGEVKRISLKNDLSLASDITCTYSQVLSANYQSDEISHYLPKPETHPLIFTFSKLSDEKLSQLSYIDSTQTIKNVPLIKLLEDQEKIIYFEGTGETYLTIHTLYKQMGVSTYTKNINILGIIPSATLAMGSCIES